MGIIYYMETKIFEQIKKIVKERFGKDIEISTVLNETGIDSLSLLDLVVDVESEYNITITDEELISMKTVDDIVKAISSKME